MRGGNAAPPEGESGLVFLQRVCRGFETLVQNVMAKGQRETVLVTHAGVITGLLSAYGVPQAQPTQWMCQPGCGYSVRSTSCALASTRSPPSPLVTRPMSSTWLIS